MLLSNFKVRFFFEGQRYAQDFNAPSIEFAKQNAEKNVNSGAALGAKVLEYRGVTWHEVASYGVTN